FTLKIFNQPDHSLTEAPQGIDRDQKVFSLITIWFTGLYGAIEGQGFNSGKFSQVDNLLTITKWKLQIAVLSVKIGKFIKQIQKVFLMRWSQLKKRIEIGATSYRKSHDQVGRGWIAIDKCQIINMCTITYEIELFQRRQRENLSYQEMGRKLNEMNIFCQYDWYKSLSIYLNLSIDEIIDSDNEIVRAIGMIDSRTGKRKLKKFDVSNEHELVKRLYDFRCNAEGLFTTFDFEDEPSFTTPLPVNRLSKISSEDKVKQREADRKLANARKTHKVRNLIEAIYNGQINENNLDREISKIIFEGFKNSSDPLILLKTLRYLEGKSKLIKEANHIRGVIALTAKSSQWLRPLDTWQPSSHNVGKQFSSLSRHLLANYKVPLFMDAAWLKDNEVYQSWFINLGGGKNIRSAENLPITLTKKIAHCFLEAPNNYSIEAALRWGQVIALGGNKRLTDALLETRLINSFEHDDFWLSVIRFFINNPMLDTIHINPIIDYIHHQKYENQIRFLERGVAEEIGPAQPNFTMRGRTVNSILRQVDIWHGQLGKERKGGNLIWKKSSFNDFKFIEGTKENKNMKIWRIRELLNSRELIAEGRHHSHCVATYSQSCFNGLCSIWSMQVETEEGIENILTIEVNNRNREIRQVRGKRNRLSTEKEKEILKRWASKESITIASYI
ncbi:MAG: PcfJ domain-containing protein, partial [Deltaproteobacteria bacterium]|nr:PcfJ domain-containing protein [Deltaproteobacteria bacterium]